MAGQDGRAKALFVARLLKQIGVGARHVVVNDAADLARRRPARGVLALVIETTGALPLLDVIDAFADDGSTRGLHLADVITVIDAPRFFAMFDEDQEAEEPGLDDDAPTKLERLINDIELAGTLALVNVDARAEPRDEATIRDTLRALNPAARLFADGLPDGSGFDLRRCYRESSWLNIPPSDHRSVRDTGIEVFKYCARRPFHPARLAATLSSAWAGVLRSKGFVWIASRGDERGVYLQAGNTWRLSGAGPWWASTPMHGWPDDETELSEIRAAWNLRVGDRRQEIVFVGSGLRQSEIKRDLDAALLDESELAAGPTLWRQFRDPLPAWEAGACAAEIDAATSPPESRSTFHNRTHPDSSAVTRT